ncbi:MAG: hypothetical protein H6978_12515 [Gammaproteobacteria bacterium]|nr:hypothetical protein [Gammaproteobacteria bacterium]
MMPGISRAHAAIVALSGVLAATSARAEIGRVYHPYVEPHRSAIELRGLLPLESERETANIQQFQLGYERSISDRVGVEAYIAGHKPDDESLAFDAVELETRWQITEQGEYASDWGMLLEVERNTDIPEWAITAWVLWEKEFGRSSLAINTGLNYEFDPPVDDPLEFKLRSQWRYRLSRVFEPAIEFYYDASTTGLGPAAVGDIALGKRKLHWELAFIAGLRQRTPAHNIRFMVEFEF